MNLNNSKMVKAQNIVIIDYGMGNIGSIINMFKFLGVDAKLSSDKETISSADKLILPGVGHFDKAMVNIDKLGLFDTIQDIALLRKVPFLGICLGMQLMCKRSDEGVLPGLSLINAEVNKFVFPEESKLKVPHMGWNYVDVKKKSEVLVGIDNQSRFYFVHSYFVNCNSDSDVLTKTTYDFPFVSAFERDNLFGVQFHPEKSHRYGITLFKNFIDRI